MIVIDASAALSILLRTAAAPSLEVRLFAHQEILHAPHLIDLELAQVLRRYVRSGVMNDAEAQQTLEGWRLFPVSRHGHDLLLRRVWELRDAMSAYDAAYVSLAEAFGAPLVTADARLGRAHGHLAQIEVFAA